MTNQALIVVSNDKNDLQFNLNTAIIRESQFAIQDHGAFTIALSGGSLPALLQTMNEAALALGISDLMYESWYVVLADERCVDSNDPDSNYGILREEFFSKVTIPETQIYPINESLLANSPDEIALDYEARLKSVLEYSNGQLDLAVLGFGPDGHTCSLFPDHVLLQENQKLVSSISDSPKPPPKRITMTLPVLNSMTRNVIFCGAGDSKAPIVSNVFDVVKNCAVNEFSKNCGCYIGSYNEPPPYPCAMVRPSLSSMKSEELEETKVKLRVIWMLDTFAFTNVPVSTV